VTAATAGYCGGCGLSLPTIAEVIAYMDRCRIEVRAKLTVAFGRAQDATKKRDSITGPQWAVESAIAGVAVDAWQDQRTEAIHQLDVVISTSSNHLRSIETGTCAACRGRTP
jgi:hypothetical protein